jgi:3' exoribonuclease, RNase T-like
MDFVFDAEFLDAPDGRLIGISIGIVCVQDGREFYAVNAHLPEREVRSGWLGENVWPYLPVRLDGYLDDSHPAVLHPAEMAEALSEFFLPGSNDCTPHRLWAWHAGFDFVVLCRFLGGFLNVPDHVGTWVRDLKTVHVDAGCPKLPEQAICEHHPLHDARWGVEVGWALGVFGPDRPENRVALGDPGALR